MGVSVVAYNCLSPRRTRPLARSLDAAFSVASVAICHLPVRPVTTAPSSGNRARENLTETCDGLLRDVSTVVSRWHVSRSHPALLALFIIRRDRPEHGARLYAVIDIYAAARHSTAALLESINTNINNTVLR